MKDRLFDSVTRQVGDTLTRRSLMMLTTAGFAAALANPFVTAAKKQGRKKHKRRKRRQPTVVTVTVPAPSPPPVTCPNGTFIVANQCVRPCGDVCTADGGACLATFDFVPYCIQDPGSCQLVPKTCGDHADCGAGELCGRTPCGPSDTLTFRCVPFLT